jgi:hypothetical protein
MVIPSMKEAIVNSPARAVLALMIVAFGIVASTPALARGFSRGHGGSVRFGLFVGAPLVLASGYYGPHYYYPSPYYSPYYSPYPPAVAVPVAPPTYVEQGQVSAPAAPAAPQQGYWYYCNGSQAYYPYVKECPGGWQRVSPQPPG